MPSDKRRWFDILLNNKGFAKLDDDDDDSDIIPDDEEDDDEEDLIDDGLEDDDDEDGVVIDLDDKKTRNTAFANMRVENKKLAEENERLKRQTISAPPINQPSAAPRGTADPNSPRNWGDAEWDDLAQKDWKRAIDLRSQINAENIVNNTRVLDKDTTVLEKSKELVASKHPELEEDNSEKTKIYLEILRENPRYLTDPKGPVHAMRDMEERMREKGYPEEQIVAAEKRGANREKSRQSRVVLTSNKGRSNSPSDRKVHLSKDDLEFCRFNGIEPKEYAKNKLRMSKKGAVQL